MFLRGESLLKKKKVAKCDIPFIQFFQGVTDLQTNDVFCSYLWTRSILSPLPLSFTPDIRNFLYAFSWELVLFILHQDITVIWLVSFFFEYCCSVVTRLSTTRPSAVVVVSVSFLCSFYLDVHCS